MSEMESREFVTAALVHLIVVTQDKTKYSI